MPYRAPGAPKGAKSFLKGKPIRYYRPKGSAAVRHLIDEGFQAFNAARLGEACHIFTDKMLAKSHDTTIALTVAGALTPAGLGGCIISMMERGLVDFVISTGANLYHELHQALGKHLLKVRPGCASYSVVAAAAKFGVPIYTSSPGDSSIGMNIAYHELINRSTLQVDPNKDVNEVCAIIRAAEKNGCVIL